LDDTPFCCAIGGLVNISGRFSLKEFLMTYNNKHTGEEKVNQGYSRHEFIKVGAFTVGSAGASSIYGLASAQAAVKSKRLSLSMAGYNFDRTRALIDGRVKIEG